MIELDDEPFDITTYVLIAGVGEQGIRALHSVKEKIDIYGKNRKPRKKTWDRDIAYQFLEIPSERGTVSEEVFQAVRDKDMILLLIDSDDNTAICMTEEIGKTNDALSIGFLLGGTAQSSSVNSRVSSALDCFIDLRSLKTADESDKEPVAYTIIRGLTASLSEHLLIDMDFADLITVLRKAGEVKFGIGHAAYMEADKKTMSTATETALKMLEESADVSGSKRFFAIIECREEYVSLEDAAAAQGILEQIAGDEDSFGIFTVFFSERLQDGVGALILAAEKSV